MTPNKTSALGYRVIATFSITQTACEKPVLEAIQKFLVVGLSKLNPQKPLVVVQFASTKSMRLKIY